MKTKKAFTLIELSLSLAFISILLVSIALTVIQMAGSYNKGIIIKYITNAGVEISSDMQRSIASANAGDIVFLDAKPYGGRLCLKNYSYIWNYGSYFSDSRAFKSYPNSASAANTSVITGLIKAPDSTSSYCTPTGTSNPLYPYVNMDNSVNLLSGNSGNRNIVVHSFTLTQNDSTYDESSGSRLYTVTFQIGTNNKSAIDFTQNPLRCYSSGVGADLNYCQVQQFSFTVMSGNLYKQ